MSPEGLASFRRLPADVRREFDTLLLDFGSATRLRLPGEYATHQLEGAKDLWTLKVGPYRGIFRWDGAEARFIRFGHRGTIYERLPK
jgi:mRNA-degrading endonuclease RelE of RelBE toxin-antitoxin system